MNTLWLDTETFSDVPIKNGTHRYAEAVEIIIASFAWNDDPVIVWDMTDGTHTLADIQRLADRADQIIVHNSGFDRTVLRHVGVVIPPEKIIDTMVQALSHSLPGSLDTLCEVLAVPQDKAKLKTGKRHIQLFCKPLSANRKLRRATRETHPAEWAEFLTYAGMDIVSMREVRRRLPEWNYPRSEERELWLLDQRVNDRGITVDVDLAHAALRAANRAQDSLARQAQDLTGGSVQAATQRDRVIAYLSEVHGFVVDDLKGGTVDRILAELDPPPEVREMLVIRQQAAATSPAKYKSLLNGVSKDGRLRGTIQFCGAARTGRDSGRLFQPQNLPRPSLSNPEIEAGIEAMKGDVEDLVFNDVMELCTSAVRGCIVAPPGHKLVVADLSNIEGRMLAWLAGEEWKLKAFRDFDRGIGHDLYKVTAGGILNKDPSQVTKDERQSSGKVPELACGYQGALGAFNSMAALYGINLPDETVLQIVKAWRAKHPMTVKLWYGLERAACEASQNAGNTHRIGRLAVQRDGAWLRLRLPSGRYLCYAAPQVEDDKLSHAGINQYTRRWERLKTYGGKLVENATQTASRDVLMYGLRLAEDAGYKVVLRVHDELICEVPDDPAFSAEGLSAIMSTNPPWAEGLPLAAAGFECKRYRKGD